MKILYVITQADKGGAQTYVELLARHFQGAIAAGSEKDQLFKDAGAAGIKTFRLKHLKRKISPWHDALAVFEMASLLKKENPDIVHLNSTKAGLLGSMAGVLAKIHPPFSDSAAENSGFKIIFTAHGFAFSEPRALIFRRALIFLEKFASLFRDFIIAGSEADRASAIKNGIIGAKKIATVYNGLPPLNFLARDEARAQLGLPQSVIVCGNIANFYHTKGQDILIDAVAMLPPEILDKTVFLLFGDGPELEKCRQKIKSLGLESSFRLPGQIQNASSYLKALDVFILPSRKEGLPFSILEAMQAGRPIVASRVGGVPEALGNAGLLTDSSSRDDLAEALVKIIRDKLLREKLGEEALLRSSLFSQEKMLRQIAEIYQMIKAGK